MIARSETPALLIHGDHFPAALFRGEQQLGGYRKAHLSGVGEVSWGSHYRAVIPEIKIVGSIRQNGVPSTESPIIPHFVENAFFSDGNLSLHLPTLRAMPNKSAADEIDIATGIITRRVGVLELNSRMDFVQGNNKVYLDVDSNWADLEGISSHFTHSTSVSQNHFAKTDVLYMGWIYGLDRFRSFIDQQKALSTPVTFWYPMITPTIERHSFPAVYQKIGENHLSVAGTVISPSLATTVFLV